MTENNEINPDGTTTVFVSEEQKRRNAQRTIDNMKKEEAPKTHPINSPEQIKKNLIAFEAGEKETEAQIEEERRKTKAKLENALDLDADK
jgi:hypothetical protein